MTQFVRRTGRSGAVLTATTYVLVSLLAAAASGPLGVLLSAEGVSPMSSASAVAILSAIASGMMALTAIVFSLVFVAVQLGNTSYSPRLIAVLGDDNFLAHALGIFSGTFLYALMAIRSVDIEGGPGISTSVTIVALVWLLASVGALVLLLPRIRGLALGQVLVALQHRAYSVAARVYPLELDGHWSMPHATARAAVTQVIRYAGPPRYLVGLDLERLVRVAADADAEIVVPGAIGDELVDGDSLAIVHGGTRAVDERRLHRSFWLARERMIDNDPAYAIRLLVDIAIRALSPAVNDPTTAVSVLGELDGVLRFLGQRRLDDNRSRDARGVVRVERAVPSWDDLVALALTEIHQYGLDAYQVQRRLSAMLHDLTALLPAERAHVLERFARWRGQRLHSVRDAAQGWIDPTTIDRQGLGHHVVRE
jgi:uncharacterized membrane protein